MNNSSQWSYSVVVITSDFESENLSSNLSKTYFIFLLILLSVSKKNTSITKILQ